MPHKSDPPSEGFDENGTPIWGSHQSEFCKGHNHYLPRSDFAGVEWVEYYCRACMAQKRKDDQEASQKPEKNSLAYTHLIRVKETGKIFKYHVLSGEIPNSCIIVYEVSPGYLLPKKFRKYPVYEKS